MVITKNYFYSGHTGEGVCFSDIISYKYQPDEDVGRLIIQSKAMDEPLSFYISTDNPEGTAKRIMDRISKSAAKVRLQ